MKKEIKFRAWDEVSHKFVSDYDTVYIESDGTIFMGNGYDGFHRVGYIIQLFTGLRDKEENNIYEGDILLVDERRIVVVVWHEHAASWDTDFISDKLPNNGFNELKNAHWYFRTKVIGNIYENPELLK